MEIFDTLWQLAINLKDLTVGLLALLLRHALLIAWVAWWLFGINWKRMWTNLGQGAWLPLVLIMVVAAFVWSRLAPGDCDCLGFMTLPNFWWQLGAVGLLALFTFVCGWLQGYFGWTPAEADLNPPPPMALHPHEHH